MKVLGIDIGTTTISLVVLDPEQKKVWESRTISNGTFMETAREWERIQDVNKIVEKTFEAVNYHSFDGKDTELDEILKDAQMLPLMSE